MKKMYGAPHEWLSCGCERCIRRREDFRRETARLREQIDKHKREKE